MFGCALAVYGRMGATWGTEGYKSPYARIHAEKGTTASVTVICIRFIPGLFGVQTYNRVMAINPAQHVFSLVVTGSDRSSPVRRLAPTALGNLPPDR